jgi:hypothetical protein
MKTINQFRKTDKFCILSHAVEDMAKLVAFLSATKWSLIAVSATKWSLIAVASRPDAGLHDYTIRVIDHNESNYATLIDIEVSVDYDGKVKVQEIHTVMKT